MGELPEVMATAESCGEDCNMMENSFSILIVIFPNKSNKPRPQTESCAFASLADLDQCGLSDSETDRGGDKEKKEHK